MATLEVVADEITTPVDDSSRKHLPQITFPPSGVRAAWARRRAPISGHGQTPIPLHRLARALL